MRGSHYAFLSSALTGSFQVTSKLLLNSANQPTVMTFWFMFGSIFQPLIGILIHKRKFFTLVRKHLRNGLTLGLANLFTAGFFFTSINVLGPAPTAFFAKLDIVFILLIGYLFMKENLTRREIIGVVVAFAGSLIFASATASLGLLSLIGIGAAFFNAVHTLLARRFTQNVPITVLQTFRATTTFAVLLPFTLLSGQLQMISWEFIVIALIGVLLGPVAGVAAFYAAVKNMKASIVSLIRNLEPFFALIYIFIIFGTIPSTQEFIGGILIVAGVTVALLRDPHYDLIFKKFRKTNFI